MFLLSAMIVTSPTQARTVGVSKSDWVKYNVNLRARINSHRCPLRAQTVFSEKNELG